MTPMAAQLFRRGDMEDQKLLARCQFFECSRIMDMAQEMGRADVQAGGSDYSLSAQLPAPFSAIEAHTSQGRFLMICEQRETTIAYVFWISGADGGKPQPRFSSGFVLGTQQNTEIQWASFRGELERHDVLPPRERDSVLGFNLLLEKTLCIINQPGLIERLPRDTDKRVVRVAKDLEGRPDVSKFFECRIRPGQHGDPGQSSADFMRMPLHYVRKHLRPSSGRWVDGYWRGDADLGIHLKWYSPSPPPKGVAT